ncbi:aspartate aminotransferase family protein [Muricoccus radiodurans]|uniref:aspartate aminotransferase family protein n=1 Tax=Muricoccus radiodurans TaxID=2231721 RepID=UPI003CFB7C9E
MPSPNSLHARDIAYHLHPQTNLTRHEAIGPVVMVRGNGVHVYDDAGREYLDAMSGMWSASLGFSDQRLTAAAARQMERLPYYQTFAHRSTEPATELAETLIRLSPVPMSKVLFQSSGSEANDTSIKLAWYWAHATGRPGKRKIISRRRAYHGTTIASASLTGLPHLHSLFNLPLDGFLHLTTPHHYREGLPGESEEAFATRLAEELEALILREGADTIAAFFAEPVMGTGGVLTPPATYFQKVQAVLRRHDILFVADEVICGFGRTGNWWGCQTYGLEPDMITCAKALSASYAPISAILLSESIYQAMKRNADQVGVFGHGFTYGGHPVAAAVALETLRIYEGDNLIEHAANVGGRLQEGLRRLADHPMVGEVRGVGLMAAVEVVRDRETRAAFDPAAKVGAEVQRLAQEEGLIARALGDSLCFAPPLITTESEVDVILARFGRALDRTLEWVDAQGLRPVTPSPEEVQTL